MSNSMTIAQLFKGQKCKQDFKADFGGAIKEDFTVDFAFDSSGVLQPPVVSFSSSGLSGVAPYNMNLSASATNNPSSFLWVFGDGSSSNQDSPSHVYQAGTYTFTVYATNEAGTGSTSGVVHVSPTVIPTAAFTATPVSGAHPLTVQFTDGSTNSPTSWSWNFGDGGTSTQQNPSYTYAAAGTYTVSLTATNQAGSNTGTRSNYITVS